MVPCLINSHPSAMGVWNHLEVHYVINSLSYMQGTWTFGLQVINLLLFYAICLLFVEFMERLRRFVIEIHVFIGSYWLV